MKARLQSKFLVCSALFATALPNPAAPVTKSDTGADLNDGASWGGAAPGAADTATWDGTSLGAGLTLDTSAEWAGIDVNGAASDIDISGVGVLTLGANGIDTQGSGVNLSIANDIVLSSTQSWLVGGDLTSTGQISGSGGLVISGESGETAPEDTYTFLEGANVDLANVSNVGIENAWVRGDGKLAYFQNGSLEAVITPEPGTILLSGLGILGLFTRRRRTF
jgi:hypothetical protein